MTGLSLCGVGDEAGAPLRLQLAAQESLDWHLLELRTIDGLPLTALDGRALRQVARLVADAGMSVPALASNIGNWSRPVSSPFGVDLEEMEAIVRAAQVLGARIVRVMSYPNDGLSEVAWRETVVKRFRELARRAEVGGVVLAVENCAGWTADDPARALDLLAAVDSPNLRLLFDSGNPVAHHYDGIAYLTQVIPHVVHFHVKDSVAGPGPDQVRFVPVGEGDARIADCLRLSLGGGYAGVFSIEPEITRRMHEGVLGDDKELHSSYLSAGRAFERLLGEEFAPSAVAAGELRLEGRPS